MLFYQTLAFTIWKNIKKLYKNNTFKISSLIWNEEFELLHGLYSVSDIQDSFENILKKHERVVDNPSEKRYINKIENRIIFKIKRGHYLELLTPEPMKLFGSLKSKIAKDKIADDVSYLEITR